MPRSTANTDAKTFMMLPAGVRITGDWAGAIVPCQLSAPGDGIKFRCPCAYCWQTRDALQLVQPPEQYNAEEDLFVAVSQVNVVMNRRGKSPDPSIQTKLQQPKDTVYWVSQDYCVRPSWVQWIKQELGVNIDIEAFASTGNNTHEVWWGEGSELQQDAFKASWSKGVFWMNPPYSDWDEVIPKIKRDKAHAVLILPQWRSRPWYPAAKEMQVRVVYIPKGTYLFQLHGKVCRPTHWAVEAMLVCGHQARCDIPKAETTTQRTVHQVDLQWRSKAAKRKIRKRVLEHHRGL